MNLALSEEQRMLKDTFARLFAKESSIARVRAAAPLGFDPALWSSLLGTGAPVARVPEDAGGLDMSLLDAAIIAEEAGRALASAPLIEVMVTARLLASTKAGAPWIEKIGQGAIVVPALHPARGGILQTVPGGAVAEAVVALDGDQLILVTGPQKGDPQPNVGQMPIASWNLQNALRTVLATGTEAKQAMDLLISEWKILSAATLTGLARQALELAAAYAKERVQFGRPIGTFQGLAHPLANAVTDVDGGKLLVQKAIWAAATNATDAGALLSLAWWWMGQTTVTAVRRSVRTLGGYGLALEYDLQLYNRRGNALVLLGGDPLKELEHAGEVLHGGARAAVPKSTEVGISFSPGEIGSRHAERLEAFFKENWDDRMRAKAHHSSASHDAVFHRKLAQAGLIYGSWPTEHGGRKASVAEDAAAALVFEKWNYTSHIIVVANLVGKIVMRHGSDAAKAEILPKIKAGDAVCSLGFSEPASGSDVFAAKTAAVRDGDDWVINGQKMFTTGGHLADYVLLLTRTSTTGAKHQGLTLFIVPTKLKGYEAQPVKTYMDERTNVTFYSDLRLPDKYRIGKAEEGAAVLADALTLEHGGGNYFSGQDRMMRNALAWAETRDASGARPLDDKSIRTRLAKVRARFEVAKCFAARDAWAADAGHMDRSWGPMGKLFISESFLESSWELLEMAGEAGILTGTDPLGTVELDHRRAYGATIYGGTSEVHRSIIAEQALGLPKSRS